MYSRRVDRDHPSALVFLIDQSASMADPIQGSPQSKSAVVAEQLNGLLFELIQKCTKTVGETPRPYFAVSIVSYRTDDEGVARVGPAVQGELATMPWAWAGDLAENPLRIDERTRTGPSGDRHRFVAPVWVDPMAQGGTPMCAAFDYAGRLTRSWCDRYPDSLPPIVINISDGESTDGDPEEWSRRLRTLRTSDGNLLLFNLGIGGEESPAIFTAQPPEGASDYTSLLWRMSSELPEFMVRVAEAQGFSIAPGARGFGTNADFRNVITFLNVGTSVGHLLR